MSIIPGIETRAPERTETSSGLSGVAEARADAAPDLLDGLAHRILEAVGVVAAEGVEGVADLGGDGEAGRDWNAEAAHLGEAGALAAKQVAHRGVAVGAAAAEAKDRREAGRRGLAFGRGGGHRWPLAGATRSRAVGSGHGTQRTRAATGSRCPRTLDAV